MNARLAGLLSALVFLLIGSGQMFLAMRLPGGLGPNAAEPGPGLFPMLVGSLMCLAACAHLVQTWRVHSDARGDGRLPVDIMLLTATIAGYILLLPRAGFLVSAFLLLLCTLSIYGMPGMGRRAATAAAATGIAYLVFTKGLLVNMPTPTWFN